MITRWGFPALAFSLQMEPEVLQPVVTKIITTKGSRWPKSTTKNISLLRLTIFQVVCGVNPIEPLLLVLNKWMEYGNTWKNGDLRRCFTKNKHLGLQLDMASQRCLVADCGFWFATSALAPLASRRGKNWKSECRPDMIRVIENHRFQTFFFDPWRAKSSHRAGETQISTLESHACQSKWMSMLQAFFDDSCKYQHFVSYPQKSEFQIRHPYKGAESTGCLVYTSKLSQKVASWSLNSTPAISSYLSEVNHGWTMAEPWQRRACSSFFNPSGPRSGSDSRDSMAIPDSERRSEHSWALNGARNGWNSATFWKNVLEKLHATVLHMQKFVYLIGGWATPSTKIWKSDWIIIPTMKIKNVPNHQPDCI